MQELDCLSQLFPDKHDINFISAYLSRHVKHIAGLHLLDMDKLA